MNKRDIQATQRPGGATIVDILAARGRDTPDKVAFSFRREIDAELKSLTFAGAWSESLRLGAALREAGLRPGDRALLLYSSNSGFVAGFLACLIWKLVAVPSYPPRNRRHMARIAHIARDSGASAILCNGRDRDRIAEWSGELGMALPRGILATDEDSRFSQACGEEPPALEGSDLAFLQYTSGSTQDPKGVMVTHDNIVANAIAQARATGIDGEMSLASWLPLFHDMGLFGGLLQPIFAGSTSYLFPPEAFLNRPALWMEAMSAFRAGASAGPSFAFELCVAKAGETGRAGLDLSCVRCLCNGSEPIRPDVLDAFYARFRGFGLAETALYPCYGMAETTLFATSKPPGAKPKTARFCRHELEKQSAVSPSEGAAASRLASCGKTSGDETLKIVDPVRRIALEDGAVGEIWFKGPQVARGYWNKPEETERAFAARLADSGEGTFLRTGDLGFLHEGELYVCGRLKDVMIVRGRNFYPQDIERAAELAHPAVRPSHVAAFSVEFDGEESLVVACEVLRESLRSLDADSAIAQIRASILAEAEVDPRAICLIRPASIPKTSSGKIQRGKTKEGYLAGTLSIVGSWQRKDDVADAFAAELEGDLARAGSLAVGAAGREAIRSALVASIARLCERPAEAIDPSLTLIELGVDSLAALQAKRAIADLFGIEVSIESLADASIAELANLIYERVCLLPLLRHPRGNAAEVEEIEEFAL